MRLLKLLALCYIIAYNDIYYNIFLFKELLKQSCKKIKYAKLFGIVYSSRIQRGEKIGIDLTAFSKKRFGQRIQVYIPMRVYESVKLTNFTKK